MKITRKNNNKVDFASLKNGDVFQDGDNIFMAIDEVENKNGGSYNTVNLETGVLTRFYGDEYVIPIKAELVVG